MASSIYKALGGGLLRIPPSETFALIKAAGTNTRGDDAAKALWKLLSAPVCSSARDISGKTPDEVTTDGYLEDIKLAEKSKMKLLCVVRFCHESSSPAGQDQAYPYNSFQDLMDGNPKQISNFMKYYVRMKYQMLDLPIDDEPLDKTADDDANSGAEEDDDLHFTIAPKKKILVRDSNANLNDEDNVELFDSSGVEASILGVNDAAWTRFDDGDMGLKVTTRSADGLLSRKLWTGFNLPRTDFIKLKPHQKDGVMWNVGRFLEGRGGICTLS